MKSFSVATIGFMEREQRVLKSVFAISMNRNPSFAPYVFRRDMPADVVLVAADNPQAMNGWSAYRRIHQGQKAKPVIMLAREKPEGEVKYHLHRPVMVSRLLAMLEQVAIDEFGYAPVLAIQTKEEDGDSPPMVMSRSSNNITALVVDDSLPVRIQMKMALQGIASQVEFAETGEQALELLASNRYSIIFLDVILPGIDGYKVCRTIKKDPEKQQTPVIMLTGNSSSTDRVKGKLAGCDAYLIKPVKQAVFREIIDRYIPAMVTS